MAGTTKRFMFTTFDQPTDRLDLNGYKFGNADRVLMDRLLSFATENHTHNGALVSMVAPTPPSLALITTEGALRPQSTIYYRYSIVDSRGQEGMASPAAAIRTPPKLEAPALPPRLQAQVGTMEGGEYVYGLTACSSAENTQETLLGPIVAGTLSRDGSWRLDLPAPPSGAHHFNLYRRGPRDDELFYLTSLPPDALWIEDTGDLKPDRLHRVPSANTTSLTNSVGISPTDFRWSDGTWSWKIYRTYDPAHWENSLLDWVGAWLGYIDDGRPTRLGAPPEISSAVGGPPKIQLGGETEGAIPSGLLTQTRMVTFTSDLIVEGPGDWYYVNEYDLSHPERLVASVGRNVPPAADLKIGLERSTWGAARYPESWTPLLNTSGQPAMCVIRAGQTTSLSITDFEPVPAGTLRPGEVLRLRVYQAENDASPAGADLTVTLTLRVRLGQADQSYLWKAT